MIAKKNQEPCQRDNYQLNWSWTYSKDKEEWVMQGQAIEQEGRED